MRGAPASRRRQNEPSSATGGGARQSRDSDASLCSSRPSSSSIGVGRPSSASVAITDRSSQISALRTINTYLSSHSPSLSLKPPLPSAKDITEAFTFILSRLNFPTSKLDQDLLTLLKHLSCPIKLNKSALRAPGTPHAWPFLLSVLHWLVQIAAYNDHISSISNSTTFLQDNTMFAYALDSYLDFIRGDDESVDALDREFLEKLERERDSVVENVKLLSNEVARVEAEVEALRSGPSPKEKLEKERCLLEEDEKKFLSLINQLSDAISIADKSLEEKQKEVDAKVLENNKILEENEEIRKRIELQTFNARDAERMKRELQAVERDTGDAEISRNSWEDKCWDLERTLAQEFKQLEAISIECNQAIRRLKFGNGIQYVLNSKGSTPVEVLGIDYKTTLKLALDSFLGDINKSSMAKLEELISLQQQSVETTGKIEAKRNRIAALQSHIDELNFLRKETQDYTSGCAAKAHKLAAEVEAEACKLDSVEREAAEILKASKLKHQEAVKQTEEEIQKCAHELFALVDSVSKHKEYMASKISQMKTHLLETTSAISDAFNESFPL